MTVLKPEIRTMGINFLVLVLTQFICEGVALAQVPSFASLTNECAKPMPHWIWCEDFELDRSDSYFEGAANRTKQQGINQSVAGAFTFKKGSRGAGGIKVAFGVTPNPYIKPVDAGQQKYQEIFWRLFVRVPKDWKSQGADKLSRATILSSDKWTQAMIAHVWSGADPGPNAAYLYIDPAKGVNESGAVVTTKYNDFENLQWLGFVRSKTPVFSKEQFDQWFCVEAHVRLNTKNKKDGIFRLFINNKLEAAKIDLDWVGTYDEFGINAVFFENYLNRTSPANQTRYFDNLIISTRKIGCGE